MSPATMNQTSDDVVYDMEVEDDVPEAGAASTAADDTVYDMQLESSWWESRKALRPLAGVGASIGIHLVLMLGAACIVMPDQMRQVFKITSEIDEEANEPDYLFNASASDQIGSGNEVALTGGSQAAAVVFSKETVKEVEQRLDENFKPVMPSPDKPVEVARAEMVRTIQTRGATTHVSGGTAGTVDRLAFEIAGVLRERRALVVWIFDVSPSLSKRRSQIADRVENVYSQLNSMNVAEDKALKSAVVTFGEKYKVVTPATALIDDPADLVKAVRGIKSENGGKEYVFTAVQAAANEYSIVRKGQSRDVMFIIVTDEAGSDLEKLPDAVNACKRSGIRVYCVGEAAPFGRKQVEESFELESGEVVIGVMDRGPETFYPDRIKLPFWGVNSSDLDDMSSGFGPYGLTRLCAETGGMFLINAQSRGRRFESEIMQNYEPDYRPGTVIEGELKKSIAKQKLLEVVNMSTQKDFEIPNLQLNFRAENDNVLRQEVTEAQRPAAVLEERLNRMISVIEQGEKDRTKLSEPRWRAAYDLALGRLLASKSRILGYNKMLAEMKVSPKKFEKATNNQWRLVPAKDVTAGADVKKMAVRATEALNRLLDEHGGTPWAAIALRERETPLGWEWKEGFVDPNPPRMGNNPNDKKAPRFADEVDPKTGKKTRRMLPDAPVKREI